MNAYRKPCSCVLRYAEWSKKSFKCGISIFWPVTLTPPPVDLTRLLLLVRCLLVDFEWCVPLLLFDKLWLFVELFVTFVELLVKDSDTSRLDNNDLSLNDNFSVVSSRKLLGEFTVVWVGCSVGVNVVSDEFPSDKVSAVAEWTSVVATRPKMLVVLCNEVFLESRRQKRKQLPINSKVFAWELRSGLSALKVFWGDLIFEQNFKRSERKFRVGLLIRCFQVLLQARCFWEPYSFMRSQKYSKLSNKI